MNIRAVVRRFGGDVVRVYLVGICVQLFLNRTRLVKFHGVSKRSDVIVVNVRWCLRWRESENPRRCMTVRR